MIRCNICYQETEDHAPSSYRCRPCDRIKAWNYYWRNREKRREYYQANRDRARAYYQEHKDHLLALSRKWQQEHPERVRELGRNAYYRDPEKHNQRAMAWQRANRDRLRDRNRFMELVRRWMPDDTPEGRLLALDYVNLRIHLRKDIDDDYREEWDCFYSAERDRYSGDAVGTGPGTEKRQDNPG